MPRAHDSRERAGRDGAGGEDRRDDWRTRLERRLLDGRTVVAAGTVRLTGRVLGIGGEAVVVHAIEERFERPLALRFLGPLDEPAAAMDAARTALQAGARGCTPWTPPPIDAWIERFEDRWHPVIALPYLHGVTVHELLVDHAPLTTDEVVHVAIGIAESVDDLHRGVGGGEPLVHGDLGLENLVLLIDPSRRIVHPPRVMLLDLGGATRVGRRAAAASRLNRITVTREQLAGTSLDARTDVAAIGRLLSVMLCCELVPDESFEPGLLGGPALRAMLRLRRGLGRMAAAELDRIVDAANAEHRDGRQDDARVLAADLAAWLARRPSSRTPERRLLRLGLAAERARHAWRRRRA